MRGPIRAFAAALVLAGLLAGCGGGSPSVDVSGIGVNPEMRLADCTDWKEASTEQRLTTVEQIENFAGSQADNAAQRGPVLDDERAYEVLDTYCKEDFARAYKLYKLYERSAAFGGH